MNSLKFSFIRRSFIVPLIFSAAAICLLAFLCPKAISSSNVKSSDTMPDIDISKYELVSYDKFSKLKSGDYVASVSVESAAVNCPVLYEKDSFSGTAYMYKGSSEIWNNGTAAFIGDNTSTEFKRLWNCKCGDEVTVDYYKNGTYKYTITDISYNNTLGDVKSYLKKDNTLVLCRAYTDFEDTGDSSVYAFYVAELEAPTDE